MKQVKSSRLVIVGEGPEKQKLEEFVSQNQLKNISFTGYKQSDKLRSILAKAKFVVIPSEWYENNPRSVLEAFAFGKPVISADIGGIPELVKHDERGLLFTPGDGDQLRSHIEYCVTHPKEAIRMGMNARQYVLDKHNPEDYYDTLMNVYTTLLKG